MKTCVLASGSEGNVTYVETEHHKILLDIASNIGANLVSFNKNHYTFSAFMEKGGKFAYISISDVRHFKNEWKDNILVRSAEHERDFSGGRNTFTNLLKLENRLDKVLRSITHTISHL